MPPRPAGPVGRSAAVAAGGAGSTAWPRYVGRPGLFWLPARPPAQRGQIDTRPGPAAAAPLAAREDDFATEFVCSEQLIGVSYSLSQS